MVHRLQEVGRVSHSNVTADFLFSGPCQSPRSQIQRNVHSPSRAPTLASPIDTGRRPLLFLPTFLKHTSSSDKRQRALAAFKAIDGISIFIWPQGVLRLHQNGAGSLNGLMCDRYTMPGQKYRHCLRCSLYVENICTVYQLLH